MTKTPCHRSRGEDDSERWGSRGVDDAARVADILYDAPAGPGLTSRTDVRSIQGAEVSLGGVSRVVGGPLEQRFKSFLKFSPLSVSSYSTRAELRRGGFW